LGLEILEDRVVPSGLPPLGGTLGFIPAPSGLKPPPPLTAANQLPGPWLSGPPPSGQLPALSANMIAMADQIFAEMAALYGSSLQLAISHSAI
jgi:hypothetical protein